MAFSFHPRKLLTTGEGGMLLTADGGLAARLRRLREHGMAQRGAPARQPPAVIEHYPEFGFNYRMTDMQAALGLVQLAKLDAMVAGGARWRTATGALADIPGRSPSGRPAYGTTNFQSFGSCCRDDLPVDRDAVVQSSTAGDRHPAGDHGRPPRAGLAGLPAPALPVTERLTRRSLILPLFHEMTENEQDHVVS